MFRIYLYVDFKLFSDVDVGELFFIDLYGKFRLCGGILKFNDVWILIFNLDDIGDDEYEDVSD